ncbi:PREDICTED: probable protein phosphatase 2C 1 [Camelina sativa]|uniref:Probable protein phosphatase 2C 1 n=1 Tax=Camelina sativa TaxID=90675 RepID=A0ABM0X8G7_CAMSA|nr:PREDICTED: probable protein phosphatase 2C 1 [Camelina sativa]
MGGCVSKSTWSNEASMHRPCLGMGCCGSKMGKGAFSDRIVSLHNLVSIPNRIIGNGKSRSSCIFTQQGRKGINQDAMIVWEDFMSKDVTFCGVFDGHGPHGHLVARKVRDSLPVKLLALLNSTKSKQSGSTGTRTSKPDSLEADKEESTTEEDKLNILWEEAFLKSFNAMDKELRSHPNLECFCSGCTAVTIIKQGSNLFMGNIGDSRAILGSKDNNNSMVAVQLTVDLKPDLPREAERIKQCKGRVFALEDEPEVSRVWLPFDNAPGLAMARAFGDFCLKDYGVISIPEFSHRVLTDRDQFIVLASDGVWDVLSNEEVVEVVASASSRASAARLVVDSAVREWKLKYPTSKMDDCAVVCLFLDGRMDSESSDNEEQGISSATNAAESDESQGAEPCLQRNVTVRSSSTDQESNSYGNVIAETGNAKKETTKEGEQNWSGLEGVTRVNSLVQLPRFPGEKPEDLLRPGF